MTTPTPNDTEERIKKDAEEYADLVERRLTTAHRVRQASYNVGAKTERNKVLDEAIRNIEVRVDSLDTGTPDHNEIYTLKAVTRYLESLKVDS